MQVYFIRRCICCGKDEVQKITKTREKLIQALQLNADRTIRQPDITVQQVLKILAITNKDIVAAQANYHASCNKNFTEAK